MGHRKGGGGGSAHRSEGADQEVSSLAGVSLVATGQGLDAAFTSWACTDCPAATNLEFPTGTATGAVTGAIDDTTAASTTVTLPGPGRYEFTATWSDGTTETLTVRATRARPACAITWDSGGPDANGDVTAGGAFQFTVSDANTADSVGFSATCNHYSGAGAASIGLSESPEGTFTGTWPSQLDAGRAIVVSATSTDTYGRTATAVETARGEGVGPSNVSAPAATSENLGSGDSPATWSFSAFTDSEGRVDNYVLTDVQVTGTPTRSGSGLGVHTPTVAAGECLLTLCTARDSSNGHLATAARVINRAAVTSDPPVLTAPAVNDSDLADANSARDAAFTNSGGALASSSAIVLEKPDGSTATATNTSTSLTVQLTDPDTPGHYVIEYTATNGDGTVKGRAVYDVASIAPTADAGTSQQHSGGTVNLDWSGSSLNGGSPGPLSYSCAFAGNSPHSGADPTITGSTTSAPSFTAVIGEAYIVELTVTDDTTGETGTATVAISPAASKVTLFSFDGLSDGTTDSSIPDGDTVLYLGDGTTTKATVSVGDSITSGTPTVVVSYDTTDGLQASVTLDSGSYYYKYAAFKVDISSVDMIADQIVVDAVITVAGIESTRFNWASFVVGTTPAFRNSGSSSPWESGFMAYQENSPVGPRESGVHYSNTSWTADGPEVKTLNSGGTQDYAVAVVVEHGMVRAVYWEAGRTTLFGGIPTVSGGVEYRRLPLQTNAAGSAEATDWSGGYLYAGLLVGCFGVGETVSATVEKCTITAVGNGRV